MKSLLAIASSVLVLAATGHAPANAQTYARGQDISPTFDGWEQNADGTYTMYFGYFNRNADEEMDVPVGADNRFDQGDSDRGQPTHFILRGNGGCSRWWCRPTGRKSSV